MNDALIRERAKLAGMLQEAFPGNQIEVYEDTILIDRGGRIGREVVTMFRVIPRCHVPIGFSNDRLVLDGAAHVVGAFQDWMNESYDR
jgi:hypothetical protein